VEFCPPGLDPVVVFVFLVLLDYRGLCFFSFLCLLAGKHSREVSKGGSSPLMSPGGKAWSCFSFSTTFEARSTQSSCRHEPPNLARRCPLVQPPLATIGKLVGDRRVVIMCQGVFTPWVMRDGHTLSLFATSGGARGFLVIDCCRGSSCDSTCVSCAVSGGDTCATRAVSGGVFFRQ